MDSLAFFAASTARSEKLALRNVAVEMVDDVYQIMERINATIYGPDIDWYKYYELAIFSALRMDGPPFRDVHGFAAFLGCHDYVSYHISLGTYSLEDNEYLLTSTIRGLMRISLDILHIPGYCALMESLLCQGADPNLSLDVRENFEQSRCEYTISAWGAVLYILIGKLPPINALGAFILSGPTVDQVLQYFKVLMDSYLSRNVDVNTSIGHFIDFFHFELENSPCHLEKIGMEETPLSYLKRTTNSHEPHMIGPLVKLLRQRGALERRRFQLVCAKWDGRKCIYRVSEEESQRLCEVWPRQDGTSTENRAALFDAFLGLEASLTKHDVGDEETTLNWESSW